MAQWPLKGAIAPPGRRKPSEAGGPSIAQDVRQANKGLQAWAIRHPRLFRHVLNFYPAFRGTGAWVTFIADDWSEMRVRIPLSWRTRNYVGTIFGGSLYAGIDPHFMFMLMHRLGPDYLVWDKAATVRFRRPGRGQVTAVLRMPDDEVAAVQHALRTQDRCDRTYTVDLVAKDGTVCASVEKVVNVRRAAGNSLPHSSQAS